MRGRERRLVGGAGARKSCRLNKCNATEQLITIYVVYLKQQPQCLAECMYASANNDGDLSTQLSKKQR